MFVGLPVTTMYQATLLASTGLALLMPLGSAVGRRHVDIRIRPQSDGRSRSLGDLFYLAGVVVN